MTDTDASAGVSGKGQGNINLVGEASGEFFDDVAHDNDFMLIIA